MNEEEQEKLYDLLLKDTKNKLEQTIEKLRIANAELRDELDKKNSEIEKQQKEIEELKEKNSSLQKDIKLMKSININDNYISREEIKNVLDEHFRFYKELRKQDNYPNKAIINSDCLSRLSMLQTLYLELLEE